MYKNLLNFLVFVFLLSSNLILAQSKTKISGTVTDVNGAALPGVNIIEKGTNNGTTVDFDGQYSINVDESAILTFSSLGFESQEMTIGSQSVIDVILLGGIEALNEVVVTALGIKKEKKALAYSVQEVKAESLTTASNGNITSALQGKVAGVNITTTGGVGGNARLELRGASSLTGNDKVLWVIDGVPFSADDTNDPEDLFGGVSNGGGLLDINPDDIETVSVLKGGQAAALYGSRGANGVVLITTKSGKNAKGLGISYSSATTFSNAAYFLDVQDEYGQGVEGVYDARSGAAWGPRFDGVSRLAWTGEQLPYEAASNKIEDFARTAISIRHALAFSKANDDGNYRVSIAKDETEGVFNNNQIEKLNVDLKAAYDINSWLNIDTKISYIKNEGQQRPEVGNYSYVSFFNSMPANIRSQDLAPGYFIINDEHKEYLYGSSTDLTENPNANNRNPYFVQEQIFNRDQRNRFFGYFASTIKFTDHLSLKLKYGLDTYRYEAIDGYRFSDSTDENGRPNYNTSEKFYAEENIEFLFNYNKDISEDISFGLSAGGNKMHRESETLRSTSGKLASERDFFFNAGQNISSKETFSEREIQSLYGLLDVSYKDYLFFTATARNDWSSALPSANNSYFYPSVGLSALLSEMAEMPDWITYLKVRGSWSQLGKDTEPFQTNPVFTFSTGNFNLLTSNVPDEFVAKDLKPEISSSTEFGVEFKLFKNRFGIDLTYYNEQTENQIIPVPISQHTGFARKVANLGLISNKGIEVIANIIPIKAKNFELGLTLNFATNKGVLEEYTTPENDEEIHFFFNSSTVPVQVRAVEGEKLGDIYGFAFERDTNGTIVVDTDGLPIRTQERVALGNIQADFTGSIGLNLNYKNLSLNALFGMQQGGDIYSLTEASATGSGTAAKTLSLGRVPFFVDGNLADGGSNLQIVSPQAYWGRVSGITEEFIYDASYMKLSELSIGFTIPKKVLYKIGNGFIDRAKLSLIGRNLFYLYRNTPGTVPDAGVYNTSFGAQAFDFSPVPVTRSMGFSLNLNF